jgi:hypothetical protein
LKISLAANLNPALLTIWSMRKAPDSGVGSLQIAAFSAGSYTGRYGFMTEKAGWDIKWLSEL